MTQEQRIEKIKQLRQELGQTKQSLTDEYLEQFLIARSWNTTAAKEQLLKTFEWRQKNQVDLHPVATCENKLPVLYAVRGFDSVPDSNLEPLPGVSESVLRINTFMGGSCLHKVDKEGCPIYIERLGHHKAKDIAKHCKVEEVQEYHIGCNEFLHRVVMKDCSKKAGRHVNRETVIFDCTGMGWHQLHMPALNFIRAIADCDQQYYPETLNKFFLVNAPSAFVYVWKIVKAWLDPGTIAKIQILGSDYQKALLDQIPAENLPAFLGGTCTCQHMDGGCVPSQVLKNAKPLIAQDHNEKVPTAYNTDIMNQAKSSPLLQGPTFYTEE
ncbi:CRAL-TRIO domain-containing protein [Gilbertella persicaria]|uniref:CRAL-TRIO domain-containing protein n=1 Tax=Gilbertella persicaria TaxID=101096 RepID=UPI0022203117|nr:CRAL-TRIO domain-containing protein [Gilbertella persicaria]KAI8087869.1 CRAL-TRIO domain-containing protein [Gilbertella persicaria]